MSSISEIKEILNAPYPYHETLWEEVKSILVAAFVVGFILYVFQPFGLSMYQGSKLLVSLLFMGVTFGMGLMYSLISMKLKPPNDTPEKHTFKRWILGVLILLVFISIGNFGVSVLFLNSDFSFISFCFNVVTTAVIGIFPVTLFGFQHLLRMERRNTQKALEMSGQLKDEKVNDSASIILAVQAMENYVHIYTQKGDALSKITERRTLVSTLEDEKFGELIRCHRSYLMHPDQVIDIHGNAQGLKLTMSHAECPVIPVSRSYIGRVRERLG